MGLFGKKKKDVKKKGEISLPELPRLPKFPSLEEDEPMKLHQLPSFPSNSLGKQFSQDTIKEAVIGDEEDERLPNEFEDEGEMMGEPLQRPRSEEIGGGFSGRFGRKKSLAEPVFIRVDRFEEALNIFGETKRKISEIERVLEDIKQVKDKENKELQAWESEVRSMKAQIEKIDRDIFSKI